MERFGQVLCSNSHNGKIISHINLYCCTVKCTQGKKRSVVFVNSVAIYEEQLIQNHYQTKQLSVGQRQCSESM